MGRTKTQLESWGRLLDVVNSRLPGGQESGRMNTRVSFHDLSRDEAKTVSDSILEACPGLTAEEVHWGSSSWFYILLDEGIDVSVYYDK